MSPKPPPSLEEIYTPARRKVLKEFQDLMGERAWSLGTAAKKINTSQTTLTRLLACEYRTGHATAWIQTIARFLARERRRSAAPLAVYSPTSVASRVQEAVRLAQLERTIAMVLGASGAGKTTALRHYCATNPEAIYILAGTDVRTRGILRRIAGALGIQTAASCYTARLAVVDALRDTERVLVIDDCDYLGEDVLQALRLIHDEAGIGLVLVGTEAYLPKLRNAQSATINQVLGRISYLVQIDRTPDADLRQIAGDYGVESDAVKILIKHSGGSARRCVQAIRASARFNGATPSVKGISEAFEQLMPIE